MTDPPAGLAGVSLGRVLDNLGSTLLDLALGDPHATSRVAEIVIHDEHDASPLPPDALVLGVGVREPAEVADLLRRLGEADAAAFVVRAPVSIDDSVRAAAAASGVPLLTLTPGAAWAQVTALLQSVVSEGDAWASTTETLAGLPAGDLFSLANAVSALVDAPVTIEDTSLRVLAFSGRQEEADDPRIQTILGRQVPERIRRMLDERGVFTELYRSDKPIYVELPGAIPRIAIAVRAGDDTLGSMWAALSGPPTSEQEQAFTESAKLVALHMLRLRAGADVERRLRAELVATVLEGGPGANEAARRLQIASSSSIVLALGILDEVHTAPAARCEADRQRIADALALHLAAIHPRSASALVGGVVYGILPVSTSRKDADLRAEQVAAEFLDRTGDRCHSAIGIGRIATNVTELAQSRLDADRALRVIRSGGSARPIARIPEVYATALLLELSDLIAAETAPPHGPLSQLIAYDKKHATQLLPSLRAWLDAFGDVNAAAAAVHVHPSTFRYRLRRLVDISGLDLNEPEQRFSAMLQLRLRDTAHHGSADGTPETD